MWFISLCTVCDGIWRAVGGAPSDMADLFLGTAVSWQRLPGSSGGPSGGATHFSPQLSGYDGGPFFLLTSHLLSLDDPSCSHHCWFTQAYVFCRPLVTICDMEIQKLKRVRGKLDFKACNETFARRSPPFLWYEAPPNAVAWTFQTLWLSRLTVNHKLCFSVGYCSFL